MEQQERTDSSPINIPVSVPAPTDSKNESIVESGYQVEPNVSCDQIEQESSRIDGNATKITADAEGIIPLMEASKSDSDSGESSSKNDNFLKYPVVTEDIAASNSKNLSSSNINLEGNEELKPKIQKSKVDELMKTLDKLAKVEILIQDIEPNDEDVTGVVMNYIINRCPKPAVASPVGSNISKSSDSKSESPSESSEDSFPSNKVHISEKFPIEMEQQERTDSSQINIAVSAPTPTDSINESIIESGCQVEPNVSCNQTEQESSRIEGNTTKITEDSEGIIPLMEDSKSDSDSGEIGAKNADVPKTPVVAEDIVASNSKNKVNI